MLTDAGVYHGVKRVGADFQAQQEEEPPEWQALFGSHAIMHVQKGAKLYLYNAVFAPRGLRTRIVHDWRWPQPGRGWRTAARSISPAGVRTATASTPPKAHPWQGNGK